MNSTTPRAAVALAMALCAATLLTASGFALQARSADGEPGANTIPIVLDTTVVWSEHPSRIGVVGGWEVEPAPAAQLRMTANDVAPGRTIRVVGVVQPQSNPHLILNATIRPIGPMLTGGFTSKHPRSKDGGSDGGGGDGIDFRHEGFLTVLAPPDQFGMDDGRTYTVDGETRFDEPLVSYQSLEVGQFLRVDAVRLPSGVNLAERVRLEEVDGEDDYEGIVSAVSETALILDGGLIFVLTSTTIFNGDADAWYDIQPGWEAEVRAYTDASGMLVAVEVRAEDPDPATTNGQDFEPQQALVVPAAGADAQAIAARHEANIVGYVGDIAVLLWWPDEIDNELLAELDADPEVRAVEPNYLFRDPESVRRRYPIVDRQASDGKYFGQKSVAQTGIRPAHFAARGLGTVVAVMDTGVDPQHPVLEDRILADGLDLVDGDTEPWEERNGLDDDGDGDLDEAAGHGSFVASIVVLGAPEASILPYRVLDDDGGGNAYNLALALADAISRGVDVINLSLVYHSRSSAVDLLLEEASARGITVVCAAGNDQSTEIPFPASDSQVVGVTALREDALGLADFANRSEIVVIAAPGEEIYGALDLQQFGTSSGTSMATPFVAATVALLRSVDPALDPMLIRQAIQQTGIQIGDGLWAGYRLNIQRAVQSVAPWGDRADPPAATATD